MKHAQGLLAVAATLFMSMGPVWADPTIHDAAASPEYTRKAGGMIGRGLINVGTCPVDLLVHTVNETQRGPLVIGTVIGAVKGAGCSVLRAGSGVVDLAAFWVPGFNGFPASLSYGDCLPPGRHTADGASGDEAGMEMPAPEPVPGGAQPPSFPQSEKPRYSK